MEESKARWLTDALDFYLTNKRSDISSETFISLENLSRAIKGHL